METDIRLLLAILAPLAGAGLVMANGKRPNARETCSLLAAATLFCITASMVPALLTKAVAAAKTRAEELARS